MYNEDLKINKLELTLEPRIFSLKAGTFTTKLGYLYNDATDNMDPTMEYLMLEGYKPGMPQDSYDKQIVRDDLSTLDWDKTYPGPQLPEAVIDKTRARYIEILEILTERGL